MEKGGVEKWRIVRGQRSARMRRLGYCRPNRHDVSVIHIYIQGHKVTRIYIYVYYIFYLSIYISETHTYKNKSINIHIHSIY